MNDICATEFQTVADGVFVWSCYSEQNKVELTSTAVLHKGYIYVFDPIPLAGGPMRAEAEPSLSEVTRPEPARAPPDRFYF